MTFHPPIIIFWRQIRFHMYVFNPDGAYNGVWVCALTSLFYHLIYYLIYHLNYQKPQK